MSRPRATGLPYFFYGTLMDAQLLALVAGEPIARDRIAAARLDGFWRTGVIGRSYPVLMPRAGSRVDGILVHDLGRRARSRLDAYEGSNYRLTSVRVRVDPGTMVQAAMFEFVGFRDGLRSDRRAWRPEHWQRRWKRRALRRAGRLKGPLGDD